MDFITGFFASLFVLFCFAIWLLPIVLILGSDRTDGREKAAWVLAVIFISWFAWIFYMLLAPIRPKPRYDGYR